MNVRRLFTEHPASAGESYLQHLGVATRFGLSMVAAGLACLVHALVPFWFERTGSRCIDRLYEQMAARRRQRPIEAASRGNDSAPAGARTIQPVARRIAVR
jgi:hypothetical protein